MLSEARRDGFVIRPDLLTRPVGSLKTGDFSWGRVGKFTRALPLAVTGSGGLVPEGQSVVEGAGVERTLEGL